MFFVISNSAVFLPLWSSDICLWYLSNAQYKKCDLFNVKTVYKWLRNSVIVVIAL